MVKRIKILVLLIAVSTLSFTSAHKFYISVTQIDYVKDEQSLQITTRIFIDDFESLIRKRYDESVTLDIKDESKKVDLYIERYLGEKIKIKINNQIVSFNYLGKEYEDDIVYCYLEIEDVKSIEAFEISNKVFFDLYDEQQNIVKININNKNKSFMLIPDKSNGVLNFN